MRKIWLILIVLGIVPLISAGSPDYLSSSDYIDYVNCQEVYYFILGNNYNYTLQDLTDSGINSYYLDNYNSICLNYSDPLPLRDLPVIIIERNATKDCITDFEHDFFNWRIPLGTWSLTNKSCGFIETRMYFFTFEGESINGLRLYLLLLISFVFIIYKLARKK